MKENEREGRGREGRNGEGRRKEESGGKKDAWVWRGRGKGPRGWESGLDHLSLGFICHPPLLGCLLQFSNLHLGGDNQE